MPTVAGLFCNNRPSLAIIDFNVPMLIDIYIRKLSLSHAPIDDVPKDKNSEKCIHDSLNTSGEDILYHI